MVDGGTRLSGKRVADRRRGQGTPDGFSVDVDGNLWMGWGMGAEGLDGVSVFNPDGKLIGRIDLPERCANLCFGGPYRNRLFMCGSTACTRCTSTRRASPAARTRVEAAAGLRIFLQPAGAASRVVVSRCAARYIHSLAEERP